MSPDDEVRDRARTPPGFVGQQVLITGGFGFLGSHLAARLVALGAAVTVMDVHAEPSRDSLINLRSGLRGRLTVISGSIDDDSRVCALIAASDFSAIFHCASFATTIEKGLRFPREAVQTNTLGLVNLLEAVRLHPRPPRAFVHVSTDKVYGDARGEPYDEERTPLRPVGVYDVSKMAADAFARMYHDAYGVPAVVARLCNIFGPFDFNTADRLVPRAMKAIFGGERPQPPELYEKSSTHGRDYLYVDDCVDALLLMASTPACVGRAFNVPGCRHLGTPAMLRAIVEAAAAVERPYEPSRADQIERNGYATASAPEAPAPATIASQTSHGQRLLEATGFTPRVRLEEGLRATCLGYRELFRSREPVSQRSSTKHPIAIARPAHPLVGPV